MCLHDGKYSPSSNEVSDDHPRLQRKQFIENCSLCGKKLPYGTSLWFFNDISKIGAALIEI